MNETVELNATEIATRLLPLLKEYAAKMATISEDLAAFIGRLERGNKSVRRSLIAEVGRLMYLRYTLDEALKDLAREASGLIEHAALEYCLRGELKLRLDELEEHIRFSQALGDWIVELLKGYGLIDPVRALAEKSGRYKAPF